MYGCLQNALMHLRTVFVILLFFQVCCLPVYKSAKASGCGILNSDSMLWNEGSGASSFFTELRSVVLEQKGSVQTERVG